MNAPYFFRRSDTTLYKAFFGRNRFRKVCVKDETVYSGLKWSTERTRNPAFYRRIARDFGVKCTR